MPPEPAARSALADEVRMYVFREAAETGRVPQPPQIAAALEHSGNSVDLAVRDLAAGKVLILDPNQASIWAANPFCAVRSPFKVNSRSRTYWGICIWDALGILAALGSDGTVHASCGDCSDPMTLEVRDGKLVRSEGIIHFAVPARHWWDNIGFT